MTIVTSVWPPMPLTRKRSQSEEIGLADVPQVIGGNTATVFAHTVGGLDVGTRDDPEFNSGQAPNPAPKNPSGDYGHDHSGGAMGRSFFKSIANINFQWVLYNSSKYPFEASIGGTPGLISGTDHTTPAGVSNSSWINPVVMYPDPCLNNERTFSQRPDFHIWVPPCDPARGAFYDCIAVITFGLQPESHLTIGNPLVLTDEVTIEFMNMHTSISSEITNIADVTDIVTGLEVTQLGILTKETQGGITLVPGSINPLQLRTKLECGNVGSQPRSCQISVLDIEIGIRDASSS